jgi:manganese transport system substrate-binding protein
MSRNRSPLRAIVAAGVLAPVLLFSGCSATASAPNTEPSRDRSPGKPVVVTTFTVLADIAKNVAGDHLEVTSITKVGAEVHGYEPTPGDIRVASQADLILDNGMGLEAWFEKFVAESDAPHVTLSDGVEPIDIAEGAASGKPNPHAWMSPLNVKIYVENLVSALSELDPAHADEFAANGEAYSAKLQQLHDELVERLAELPKKKRALVSCEGAFSYAARDAGMREQYLWAVNAEQQATPRQIVATIDFVRENDVPAVFCESTVSDSAMQQVVETSGAKFGGTLFVDSLSGQEGPVPTYLDLIRYDSKLIVDALTEKNEGSS